MVGWYVLIILLALIIYFRWRFHDRFTSDVNASLAGLGGEPEINASLTGLGAEPEINVSHADLGGEPEILDETHLRELPAAVAGYIRRSGAMGKPIPRGFNVEMTGRLRATAKDAWMEFSAVQYSFLESVSRFFFLKATMKGLPVVGYHRFTGGRAVMDIRLFSLFRVQYAEGVEMNQSETVTFFNDLCIMAPGMMVDKRITWEEGSTSEVKASFASNGITVSAVLHFNEDGDLVNWVSDDRYAYNGKGPARKLRWKTPMREYKVFDGIRLPSYGEAVWEAPEGEYSYGIFNIRKVTYH